MQQITDSQDMEALASELEETVVDFSEISSVCPYCGSELKDE